jgi:hypothetical protein
MSEHFGVTYAGPAQKVKLTGNREDLPGKWRRAVSMSLTGLDLAAPGPDFDVFPFLVNEMALCIENI